jgi:multicomponent Na+:H+ antiporter subunit C
MIAVLAVTVGVLYAVGVYLMLQRNLTRIVIGLALIGHGANLVLLAAGGRAGDPPIVGGDPAAMADPLPQALALTAIVITFGVSALLLALAYRSWRHRRDDEVEDDIEDRRIARIAAGEAAGVPEDGPEEGAP